MRQISLVGAVDEEVGDYFPEFLDMLEESPFLKVGGRYIFIFFFFLNRFSLDHIHIFMHSLTRDVYSFRPETEVVYRPVSQQE